MVLVKIFEEYLNNSQPLKICTNGEHILGRGTSLNCSDRRLSRRHAVLNVRENGATLTMIHQNPCSFISKTSARIQILKQNTPVMLNDGDKFAFIEDLWYKIHLNSDEDTTEMPSFDQHTSMQNISSNMSTITLMTSFTSIRNTSPSKRSLEETQSESRKKVKLENNEPNIPEEDVDETKNGENNHEIIEIIKRADISNSNSDEDQSNHFSDTKILENKESNGEKATKSGDCSKSDEEINEQTIKQENTVASTSNPSCQENISASSSGENFSKIRREQCWYGSSCYRNNPVHKHDFSHPGDPDYDRDPKDDDRKECPYGASCYRTSLEHRREYKHPSSRPPNKKQRGRTARKKQKVVESDYSDDSEEEDPFHTDDESSTSENFDEYDSDSDYSDGQPLNDDEEVKEIYKEAKKFLKRNHL